MIIDVSTDNYLNSSEDLVQRVAESVQGKLKHFTEYINRITVYFADENRSKQGAADDKKCTLEMRIKGHDLVAVTANAGNLEHALTLALEKAKNSLTSIVGQMKEHK